MKTIIATYLSQRSIAATALCAALVMWYAASATILPAAIQFSAIPKPEGNAPARAEAAAICTGMACSIEAEQGKSCCCAPATSDNDSETSPALTIAKDCDDIDSLILATSRSIWQMPTRVANLIYAPMTVNDLSVADDETLLSSHPKEIDHIPILLCV